MATDLLGAVLGAALKGGRGGRLGRSPLGTIELPKEAEPAPKPAATPTPAPTPTPTPTPTGAPTYKGPDYGAFTLEEYKTALTPYATEKRYGEARSKLGLGGSDELLMGLVAAADVGEDAEKFTEKEKEYALELARAAKASGDLVFAPLEESKLKETLSRYSAIKPYELYKPGEKELRAGEFLRRTSLGGYGYSDFLSGKKAPATISAVPYKAATAPAATPTAPATAPFTPAPETPKASGFTLPSDITLKDRPTYKPKAEYESEITKFNTPERLSAFRKALGVGEGENPVLGLLAAANADANPSDFTDDEANYAKELARRAKTSGDKRFAGEDLDRIYRVIDAANRMDARFNELFAPGERETRSAAFISGIDQAKFLFGDYMKTVGKTRSGGLESAVDFYKD